jgi:DNA-binding transcriptional regulator GbsR (MarR family)
MSNNCNHNKENPEFIIDKSFDKRPLFLKKAQLRLEEFYSKPYKYLERLNYLSVKDKRCKRSERREAIINVGKVLLSLMQLDYDSRLKGFKVGLYKGSDKGLDYFSYNLIQSRTGYSKKRISRALKDLQSCGYIKMVFGVSCYKNTFSTKFKIFIRKSFLYGLNFKNKTIEKCVHFKRKSIEKTVQLAYGLKRTAEQTMDGLSHLKSIREILAKKLEQEAIDRYKRRNRIPI